MSTDLDQRVEAVRRFNRFYTRRIGVLEDGLLKSPFSLAEARVIYELAQRKTSTASELGKALAVDPGYLSRLLRGLRSRGLIEKTPCPADARRSSLTLSERGQEAFAELDATSAAEIRAMLKSLPGEAQKELTGAMQRISRLLDKPEGGGPPFLIRTSEPGDIGWVIYRHGYLYWQEYGWDETFEALVAEIATQFIRDADPKRERCWIAEHDGLRTGCVFLVKESDEIARLRLLLVEPRARGLGIGRHLVETCIRYARGAGYAKLTLWTNDVLHSARRIYETAGFRLVDQAPHHSFGHDLVGQNWELDL